METDRANEQARIQLVGCVRHAWISRMRVWVCAVCGRLVHLRVMCAEACGGVLQTVQRGLAFGLGTYAWGVGSSLHVDERLGANALPRCRVGPLGGRMRLALWAGLGGVVVP
jgi:hypothetical protein